MQPLRIVAIVLVLALLGAAVFLTGGRPSSGGHVTVDLRDAAGDAIDEYWIFFRTPVTLDTVFELAARDEDEQGRLPVAAGRYEVQVVPSDADDAGHFLLDFALEDGLTVRAGQVHEIVRTVQTGARLSVTATCSPAPEGDAGEVLVSWDPFQTGRVWPIWFRAAGGEGAPATDRLLRDRPHVSRDVLPTGTFPVRIEHPGYDPVELFITLEPGRVALVDTLLLPKLR